MYKNGLKDKRILYVYDRVSKVKNKSKEILVIANELFLSKRTIRRDYNQALKNRDKTTL